MDRLTLGRPDMQKRFPVLAGLSAWLALAAVPAAGTPQDLPGPVSFPRFAYVANTDDDTISIYSVEAGTGRLRHNGYHPGAAGETRPADVLIHPNGFVYVVNRGDGIGPSNVSVYTADSANGWITAQSPAVAGIDPVEMALDVAGDHAYVVATGSETVTTYDVDPGTGALTQVGAGTPTGQAPGPIALDPLGRFAYVCNLDSRSISIYDVDAGTGELSASIPALDLSGGIPSALEVSTDGAISRQTPKTCSAKQR